MTENWIKDAPCARPVPTNDSEEPRLIDFYSGDSEEKNRAKAICFECPFRLQCIQTAMDNKERWGIHGGADGDELRRNQSINAFGEAYVHKNKVIRCSYCGPLSSKTIEIIEKKRTRTHLKCTTCGLNWWARKNIKINLSNL